MKRFIIKREMAGAGSIPKNDLNSAGKGSEEVLEAMRSEGRGQRFESSMVRHFTPYKIIYFSGLLKPRGTHPHSCPYRNFGFIGPTPPRLAKHRGQPLWRSTVDAVDASMYADF